MVLSPEMATSARGTDLDALAVELFIEGRSTAELVNAAFDEVFPQESTQRARRELMARLLRRNPETVE